MSPRSQWGRLDDHWHEQAAELVRVRVAGVKSTCCDEALEWNGAFLLRERERSFERCSWQGEFPIRCGLERMRV